MVAGWKLWDDTIVRWSADQTTIRGDTRMNTRRHFLTKAAATAGMVFCGCGWPGAVHAQPANPARLPVTVNGKRVKAIDVHSHCLFHEAFDLMGADASTIVPPTIKGGPETWIVVDQRLKAMDDMASRPAVVLLMADEDHDLAARALQRGVSGFVLKSAPIRELVEAIHWAAKGQLWMSPPLLTGLLHQRPSASTTEAKGRLAQLTKREFDVLNLLIEGFHQSEISRRLFVSENTVRTHSQNLQRKLGVHSAVAAVSVALDAGLRPAA